MAPRRRSSRPVARVQRSALHAERASHQRPLQADVAGAALGGAAAAADDGDLHGERSRLTLFGVPAHLLRNAVRDAFRWLRSSLGRNRDAAFDAELKLRFFRGFVAERTR